MSPVGNDSALCAKRLPITSPYRASRRALHSASWQATHGLKSALALAAILVAGHTELSVRIPAQSMRTKQSRPTLVSSLDRSPVPYVSPYQPVNLLPRLELRRNNRHPFTNTIRKDALCANIFYDPVVTRLDKVVRNVAAAPNIWRRASGPSSKIIAKAP
jgi:hypothetical protein